MTLLYGRDFKPDDSASKNGHRHDALGHGRQDYAGSGAVRGETAAQIKRDTLSRTLGDAVRAITLDDEITVPAGDSTPGHISTSSQLQPTKLKSVSRKKALIVAAVVVAQWWSPYMCSWRRGLGLYFV